MSVWQLETSLYRHGNFVIFRGTKRDKKSHIYKSSAISIEQRTPVQGMRSLVFAFVGITK